MWKMWLREHGRWLAAGAGVMVAGFGLARFWWFEFGMALILLGAAALGYLVGLARSAVLDAELTERIDRQLDELREEQRRVQEEKWLSDGVSPIEKSWRALAQRPGAADEDPAAAAVTANDVDRRLADLIRQRCDRVWSGIKEKRYWRQVDGKTVGPDLGAIGKEIEGVVREVAGLYHQDRNDPVMEARLGDIVLMGRSVLGELLQIARLVPVVDLPAQSLATVKTRLEQIQQARVLYQQYARYKILLDVATVATRVVLGSNPVTAAAWYVGGKALTLAGTHVATKYVDALCRDALESSVALVYEHVARTYDPGRVQLSADYAALVFALDVHRRIPGVDHNRRLLLGRILRARIPDEFAKLALLRALADDGGSRCRRGAAGRPAFAAAGDASGDHGQARRDLVGEELAAPLVDSVIDLLARATPNQWPLEHDHMVLLNASVLLGASKQVEARWDRYLATVSTRLRARLKHSQASSWPKPSAPAILRASGDQELPSPGLVVTPPSVPRPLAVFEAASEVPPRWVLLFADRAVVGRAPEGIVALDDAEPEVHAREGVRFLRRKGVLSDDLVVCCGIDRLTVAGPVAGTFARFFGPVLEQYRLDADALEIEEDV